MSDVRAGPHTSCSAAIIPARPRRSPDFTATLDAAAVFDEREHDAVNRGNASALLSRDLVDGLLLA